MRRRVVYQPSIKLHLVPRRVGVALEDNFQRCIYGTVDAEVVNDAFQPSDELRPFIKLQPASTVASNMRVALTALERP